MSAICSKGTIVNIVGRGIDENEFHQLLFEVIDDAEHSNSKNVFVDIDTHRKTITVGFENPATEEQINNMVKWNAVSDIHNTSNLCTVGQGLKHYTYHARGKVVNYSVDEENNIFRESSANTHEIYKEAINRNGSESEFNDVFCKYTKHVDVKEMDEMPSSIRSIFNNDDNVYPFSPKTLIICKNISSKVLLDWLIDEKTAENPNPHNIANLRKELYCKYYHEIHHGLLNLHIKMPNSLSFETLKCELSFDVIGSTIKHMEYDINIFEAITETSSYKTNDIIICINHNNSDNYYKINKNGNSYTRTSVSPPQEDLRHLFTFTQYHFEDNKDNNKDNESYDRIKEINDKIAKHRVGTSSEDYAGVYLYFGKKFINSRPVSSSLVKRNLPGSKHYRGIMNVQNPQTKNRLQIHGLKVTFNLSNMKLFEDVIKQCTVIYKNYCRLSETTGIIPHPDKCVIVDTSNKKSVKNEILGTNYIIQVGENFWKHGYTGSKDKAKRLFSFFDDKDIEVIKQDFPEEVIYTKEKMWIWHSSYDIKNSNSVEQMVSELIISADNDIVTYANKKGDGIREYFHCDRTQIFTLIDFIIDKGVR